MGENSLEFTVIEINKKTEKKLNRKSYLVGIADSKTKTILYTTDYSDLVIDYSKDVYESKSYRQNVYELVRFLNWTYKEAPIKIRTSFVRDGISSIDFAVVQKFLNAHARGQISGMKNTPRDSTQRVTRDILTQILKNIYIKYKPEELKDHFFKRTVQYSDKTETEYELTLTLNRKPKIPNLVRFLPDEVANKLITAAKKNDPMMVLPMMLQRYMGLREGEICNIRQRHAPYEYGGPGISIKSRKGKIIGLTVILDEEYEMRSDKKSTGMIKRENRRTMPVFYLDNDITGKKITEAFFQHEKDLLDMPTEENCPMFVNNSINHKTGCHMAMTTANYKYRMKVLLEKYVIPEIEREEDSFLKSWVEELRIKKKWGPHWFRHMFTMDLVKKGYDRITIKLYRGDKSLRSADAYIMERPAFVDALKESNLRSIEEILGDICETILEAEKQAGY